MENKECIYEAMYWHLQRTAEKMEKEGGLEGLMQNLGNWPVIIGLQKKGVEDFRRIAGIVALNVGVIVTYCLLRYPRKKEETIDFESAESHCKAYKSIYLAVNRCAQNPDELLDYLKRHQARDEETARLEDNPDYRNMMFKRFKEEIEPMMREFAGYCRQRMSSGSPREATSTGHLFK